MSKHDDDDGYEVGYGKPPKASRFKKGQSGNPKGRPKGARGFRASLIRELEAPIVVRDGNRVTRISKGEAAAKRLLELALKGDMAALKSLLALDNDLMSVRASGDAAQAESAEVDQVDLDILRHFFALSGSHPPEDADDKADRQYTDPGVGGEDDSDA